MFHYFTPWYYLYLVKLHALFCHESWDSDSGENVYEDKSGTYVSWFYDAFLKEIQDAWYWTLYVFVYFFIHHFDASTVNYHFFERWNISELDEIRFYGVAPHWYFRPLMGLLVVSPSHYEGLMWMGLWFVLLASLPIIYNLYNSNNSYLSVIPMQSSMLQTLFFILFMLSMYCTASMLPCGRYYYAPEGGYVGNPWVKFSYQYAYLYLAWVIHHLDLVEQYGFQYVNHILIKNSTRLKKSSNLFKNNESNFFVRKVNKDDSKQAVKKNLILRMYVSYLYSQDSTKSRSSNDPFRAIFSRPFSSYVVNWKNPFNN